MAKAGKQAKTMSTANFNFSEPAELYGGSNWSGRPTAVTYRRFDRAADAIRYAVEELPGALRRACILEVNEDRFNDIEIRKLYDSRGYPLPRGTRKDKDAT
jgi:hypothetical protein